MKQLLIFKSQTCAPCKSLASMLKETTLNVDQITTVDSSCSKEMFMEYNVRSVPTSILKKNGEVISTYIGYTDKDKYLEFIG
jgi:thioredoxin 1